METTLAILKPDTVASGNAGKVLSRLEAEGFTLRGLKVVHLTEAQAQAFYAVHRERPFYHSLCEFMSSGPVVVQVLEGANAIEANREVMGATDPAKAAPGTIRKDFAESIEANSVHGSDAPGTAAVEIAFFFAEVDVVG